ncbi:uncharacterized protein B0H18DRAFT_340632 [Fomitopsis serialis]|uniref:uncharacterized protein n=1 Tax=Fomitopsis serialis TaxID=139415 RepID=UPI0020088D35|nr:uncharacterized protein B0H18DRAFT_340632 [Neoantrodia serialis]KAH9926396.1 hypothetical protein B0H18DRAFT_340632 [Neoantrodia serialis]
MRAQKPGVRVRYHGIACVQHGVDLTANAPGASWAYLFIIVLGYLGPACASEVCASSLRTGNGSLPEECSAHAQRQHHRCSC